jgi:periplasmic protein TonB
MNPETDMRIDNLIDEVVADLANPTLTAAFETKLRGITDGSRAMSATTMNNNVIAFDSFNQMKGKGARKTVAWAVFAHAAALLLIMTQVRALRMAAPLTVSTISFSEPPPPPAPPKLNATGGGGGQPDKTPVTQGNPPKFAPEQLNPPKVQVEDAKLTPPVTVDVQTNLRMSKSDVPQFGMPNSPLVGMSMGNGRGTGIGSGNGAGIGAGTGGGNGGGLKSVGGGVSAPVVLFAAEPVFSEEARKSKVGGIVRVYLQVDANGRPTHERVIQGIGMGLDERALEAVRQYKFKPAMENGKPVAVEMNIEVTFTIY